MKKVTRIIGAICMMGLLTFVSTSCKKTQEEGDAIVSISIPAVETEGERAYLTPNGIFMWHENDKVRVYNLDCEANNFVNSKTSVYTKITEGTVPVARFRGPSLGKKQDEGYRVFYPVEMIGGIPDTNLLNSNRQTFVVSNRQEFHSYEIEGSHHYSMVDPLAMPMAVQLDKLTDQATLRHLFGVASFSLQSPENPTGPVVVTKVVLKDKQFHLTGDLSVKLHKIAVDDSQGEEHNLNYVWDQFFDVYHGLTHEYAEDVLYPEMTYVGWVADTATLGNEIELDCVYEHADGETKGHNMLEDQQGRTDFNFILRPLALSQGFTLEVYLDGYTNPIVLDDSDFRYGSFPCDAQWGYTWGVKPAYRKIYSLSFTLPIPQN